jgi:hypothetical protein
MSTNVITKKRPTTSTTTSNTSYLSIMTPNFPTTNMTNNNTNKRRENSAGEDSVS